MAKISYEVCDRCSARLDITPKGNVISQLVNKVKKARWGFWEEIRYDIGFPAKAKMHEISLCHDCTKALEKWLEGSE